MASPKYEILNEIANKVQALDNPIKLKILAMLVEEGSKSVTDISKEMSLNFSTAHKYLEQLEAVGLVTSKQVSENRLKRIFSIGDFNMDISPHGLSNFIGQKKDAPKKTFKVLNERGEEVQFDEARFSQKYVKRGLPSATIRNALDKVVEQAYDGITLLELRELVRQELAKKLETITNVMEMIEESEIRGRTYYNLLKLNHPEALKMHMDGDIFIQNLGEPKLLNFVHDLRGIAVHGVDGKRPTNLSELFEQMLLAIGTTQTFAHKSATLDSFNTFIAPFWKSADKEKIKLFLTELEVNLEECFIGLDCGVPSFLDYLVQSGYAHDYDYSKYAAESGMITHLVLDIIKNEKLLRIKPVLKMWDKKKQIIAPGTYLANLTPKWQTLNAVYAGNRVRFDANWGGWNRTVRVGEIQNITLNLPKLAHIAQSEKEFFGKLDNMLAICIPSLYDMLELVYSESHRNYKTQFKSAQRRVWNYLHIEDCVCSIGIAGLHEAVRVLSNSEDTGLANKIINFIKLKVDHKQKSAFRLQLKAESADQIISRFTEINKIASRGQLKQCSTGVNFPSIKLSTSLHKYLLGGHCAVVSKEEVPALSDFGLVYVTEKTK